MKTFKGIEILETLDEIVQPAHTAMVVWDVQNGLVNRIFNKEEFLTNLKKLVEALRGKMPVFYTLITPLPAAFRSGWSYLSMMKRFGVDDPAKLLGFMAPGSSDREVHEAVKPGLDDILIEKSTANIFLGTDFETMLRNRGIKTIIFTGIATEIGVEHSARDASARGFYPVVATDCVSSADPEAHGRSLANLGRLAITATAFEIMTILQPA